MEIEKQHGADVTMHRLRRDALWRLRLARQGIEFLDRPSPHERQIRQTRELLRLVWIVRVASRIPVAGKCQIGVPPRIQFLTLQHDFGIHHKGLVVLVRPLPLPGRAGEHIQLPLFPIQREPEITGDPTPTVTISPIGCDGETYYYVIQLTVTDNGGLVGKDSVKIYPNCSAGSGLSVTNLLATPQGNTRSIQLTWNNPTAPFDEVMVAVKALTGFISNPSDSNYIADADFLGAGSIFENGKIVYRGNAQTVTITNLTEGTLYYFRVFTKKGTSWTGGIETIGIISIPVTGVTVSPTSANIIVGSSQQLTAAIVPSDAGNQIVT